MTTLPLREMFARLIATPSGSSTNPALDCANEGVAARLADRLEAHGFAIEPTLALLRRLVERFCITASA